MTDIYVNLNFNAADRPGVLWQDNEFDIDTTIVQQVTADLLDSTGSPTGYTLDITTAFTGDAGSTSTSTTDVGDWDQEVFDYYWYSSGSGELQIGGLTPGDTFSLELAGHASSADRDTDFTVTPSNEGTTTYNAAGTGAANPPITFTGTIGAAGTIDIVGAVVSSFWYINGFKLVVTAGGGGGPGAIPGGGSARRKPYGSGLIGRR